MLEQLILNLLLLVRYAVLYVQEHLLIHHLLFSLMLMVIVSALHRLKEWLLHLS